MTTRNSDSATGGPVKNRFCYYVCESFLVEGHGYRASVVFENEHGHRPTGNWPHVEGFDSKLPYFWGPTFSDALAQMRRCNANLGLSESDVYEIVASSMKPAQKRARKKP